MGRLRDSRIEVVLSDYNYDEALSIERKRPIVIEHSLQLSVGLSVCVYVRLSVRCNVAKRLIGYGRGLGW